MTHFRDNVVLLPGASMGIGEQLAYQLAEQRAKLALAARSADRLDAVAAACRKRGGQAVAIPTDLTDEGQCRALVEQTVAAYGRIDTLLYNAGRGYPKRFDTLPNLDTVRSEITLNYLGLVACTYYALPHLKQTRGRIIGVSSFGALIGLAGTAGYNSSKHAMRGFLNTLRAELLDTGVSVTVVYVGAVRTARLEETMGDRIGSVPTMSPERAAQLILQAGGSRRRQTVLTAPGKLLAWLYPLIPGLLDRQLARVANTYQDG
jgi:short-subunit dehydrogenase